MPTQHTVAQGEYLAKIAESYGFVNSKIIWDDPNNAALKSKRPNPNVLYPGDILYIPDKGDKTEDRATDNRWKFVLKAETLKLRLRILDLNQKPVASVKCRLTVDADSYDLTSDGAGIIEHDISRTASTGHLTVKDPSIPIDLDLDVHIGHLDPVDTKEGQQARLCSLGYYAGVPGGDEPAYFQQAVEEFQRDNSLDVDGDCGPATQDKLKSVFGC
jgi:hypothetical protein